MATSKGATDRDVVDVLMADHREADDYMAKLFVCKDAEEKKKFRHELIKTLVTHSVAEEMFVYPLMQKKLDNGEAKVKQDKAWHQKFEEIMKAMEQADPMSADFERLLKQLSEAFAQHKRDEETDQFPELRAKLPRDDLVALVGKVEMAKKVAPTHPHPSADPHAPAFHMLMGPGIGFADRLRDALSGQTAS
eukprot:TRINITY_DN844_c0_g1_i5.p1 TRINITY_DN844_c0_g1~~TRINITY_DN844_c0_g1_i5.p1  ORF type:complete len:192 (-),score=91.35 TRINITY_DN844_c0_g1_i5:598-1173(-)